MEISTDSPAAATVRYIVRVRNWSDDVLVVMDDGQPVVRMPPKESVTWKPHSGIAVHGAVTLSANGEVLFSDGYATVRNDTIAGR